MYSHTILRCAFILLYGLLAVLSEPIATNSAQRTNKFGRSLWSHRNSISSLQPLEDDVEEMKTKYDELGIRLAELEAKYEKVKEKNKEIEQRILAQESLNIQQKRLVAKLQKIAGPNTNARPENKSPEKEAGVTTTTTSSDAAIDRYEQQPPSTTSDEYSLEQDLLQINEYLGNREAELVEMNPNGEDLVIASANDFDRVSTNPSLYGKALLYLDRENQRLTERLDNLLTLLEEFKSRTTIALANRRNEMSVNTFNFPQNLDPVLQNEFETSAPVTAEEETEEETEEEEEAIQTSRRAGGVSGKSAFSVASSSSQLGVQDVPQIVKFDYVFSNKGNDFVTTNSSFVCQIPGYYYFSFSLRSFDNRYLGVTLMKNDQYEVAVYTDSSERNVMESQSVLLHLEVGDVVWLRLAPSPKFGLYSDQYHYTTFSGILVYKGN